jgi:hypothetical protein
MKKTLLPMIVLFCSTTIYSQVGVNTTSPKSTLDITAKNATGTSTNADGILIPRVDRQRALSMTSVESSTLIYVNNISTGTATGQASNIDAIGFYYFDASTSKWTKLNTNTNIYNADGTLTGNRVMSMANNSLIFRNGIEANLYFERSGTGNLQSGQNVANLYTSGYVGDTNKTLSAIKSYYRGDGTNSNSSMTFSVNGNTNNNLVLATNNNVGIGTDSPTQKLDVNGNGRFIGNNADVKVESTTATIPTLSLYRQNAGVNLPTGQIFGRVNFKGFVGGGEKDMAGIRATYQGNGTTSDSELRFSVNGEANTNMIINSSGNVGIGATAPTEKLDVNGNVRFRDVIEEQKLLSTDKIMVLDASGVAKKISIDYLKPEDTFTLDNVYFNVANSPAIYTFTSSSSNTNNINLGSYSRVVTIRPKTRAKIIINYSVPLGTQETNCTSPDNVSYLGITFRKNNSEVDSGSRKISIRGLSSAARMGTVSGIFSEEITNNGTTNLQVTYNLTGYAEGAGSGSCNVIFNMRNSTSPNYNWGHGSMATQVFTVGI